MLARRSGDDWCLPFTEPTEDVSAHKLFVEIRVETTGQMTGLGFEIFKGRNDAGGGEGFEAEKPGETGGSVDKEEGVSKTPQGDTVAVDNVKVHLVKVFSEFGNGFSLRLLRHGGEIAKCWRSFTPLDETGVVCGGDDVGGVSEFAAAEEAVEFEIGKGATSIGETRNIARADEGDLGFVGVEEGEKFRW